MVEHTLKPIYNRYSKVLILGTMPSVKSRELNAYYAHPQNRFWKVLEKVFETKILNKEEFLLSNNLALWDVVASCDIKGSSDSSIKKVVPNDIVSLIKNTNIKIVFTTGKIAYKLYNTYVFPNTLIEAISLPSPSPANCKVKFDEMVREYNKIKVFVEEE